VLAASAVAVPLLLAGCKGVQALGTPPPPPRDIRVLSAAISAEELMVARYQAALTVAAADPTARATLKSVLTEHRQHLDQLKSRLIEPVNGVSPSASPRNPAVALPGGLPATTRLLESSELAASDRLIAGLPALPPALAQLFASIAASEATHVPLLRSLRLRQAGTR
jgi:rubrerythrin